MCNPCHPRRRGFTLVELLVVIGIIAVLISILLPTLTAARQSAVRAACLSNQRQLVLALQMYAAQSKKGSLPPQLLGVDDYQSNYCYHPAFTTGEYIGQRLSADGYVGLGYLVRSKYIKEPRCFYCPGLDSIPEAYFLRFDTYQKQWQELLGPTGATTGAVYLGYNYRAHGQAVSPYITTADMNYVQNLKVGKLGKRFGGVMAITTDFPWFYYLNTFVHTKPYGICVGYTDGHGEFVDMGKRNFDIAVDMVRGYIANPGSGRTDQWAYFYYYWFALDRGDPTTFANFATSRNWSGAMAYYGHYNTLP